MLNKLSVILNAKKMKVINVLITIILLIQTILRLVLSWNDGEAKGLLLMWSIYIFALAILNILGEFRKPEHLLVWYPLILTRSGRGFMFIFLSLPMFTKEASTICLGIIVILGALLNIILGWNDQPISLEIVIDPKQINANKPPSTETEMP